MSAPQTTSDLSPGEIAVVCARYGLGDVLRADALGAGSGGAPKAVLTLAAGDRLLLKRRAPGHDAPELVRFTHEIQAQLAAHAYPVAPLRTTTDGDTMVTIGGAVYELFDFVEGGPYDRSDRATADAGRGLAYFHKILAKHLPAHRPATATFHDAPNVHTALEALTSPEGASLAKLYVDAAARADAVGFHTWPTQIIHADWHPGNMLFRNGKVAAVLDYDGARTGPRVLDAAYAAVQFSMVAAGVDPGAWPEQSDLTRLRAFFSGYETVPGATLSTAEIEALPWLMVEALIAESALGVHHGRIQGPSFLSAIGAKALWIVRRRDDVRASLNT